MPETTAGQHTPGPWTHNATGSPDYAKQYAVYPEGSGRDVAIVYDCEQAEANAQLIAAAPDLLEACRGLLAVLTAGGGHNPYPVGTQTHAALSAAMRAVAQAEGR